MTMSSNGSIVLQQNSMDIFNFVGEKVIAVFQTQVLEMANKERAVDAVMLFPDFTVIILLENAGENSQGILGIRLEIEKKDPSPAIKLRAKVFSGNLYFGTSVDTQNLNPRLHRKITIFKSAE